MSTPTFTQPAAGPGRAAIRNAASPGPGPSFFRVLNSEFIKFRTLLSTLILLASTAAGHGGLRRAVRLGNRSVRGPRPAPIPRRRQPSRHRAATSRSPSPPPAYPFAQLILGSLGVLLMSSEFTTGMARSTFAAVPKRLPAFIAKLVVVMVSAFVLTAVSAFIAGLAAVPILDNFGLKLDLASAQSVKLLLVNSAYVAAVAAIGMALGTAAAEFSGRHHEPCGPVLRGTHRVPAHSRRLLRGGPQVSPRQHRSPR